MCMIDIHCHLLAQWDDGPESWDVSIEMLRQGAQDGITEVICTPHILSRQELHKENEIVNRYEELKKRSHDAGLETKIHLGSELYIQPHLSFEKKITTLAQNGRYFLIEFSMGMIPDFVAKKFFDLLLKNKTPIIAHPERNMSIIKQPQIAVQLVQRGALLQMNAGSLMGSFGKDVKNVALQLMNSNLIHFIASDAHDVNSRPLKLRDAYEFVRKTWGGERARQLFYENQMKMMQAEDIKMGETTPIASRERLAILKKLLFFNFKKPGIPEV
jgi:protein-tyrosine phosphatase